MSKSQSDITQNEPVTPPPSSTGHPLTPPHTDKKPSTGVLRVLALFKHIQAGTHTEQDPWIEIQLAKGEYDLIEHTLRQDSVLWGFVEDKIRYDYDENKRIIIVRMPTEIHELFIDQLEDDIRCQLKVIRGGSDRKARFAQKVRPARSTTIRFNASDPSSKSKYEPDAAFRHKAAQYPGVVIEVGYSQKKKRLGRLAENYILDSYASIRVVVGLDIEYGKGKSQKATLSIWRPQLFETSDGLELRAVEEVADEAFRDDQGNPIEHSVLRLRLSDFAYEELAKKEIGDDDMEICISGKQLCQYLTEAEDTQEALGKQLFPGRIRKRKRSETPPEEIGSADEKWYADLEERTEKRIADCDVDYID